MHARLHTRLCDLLGIKVTSVQNHLERGLAKLRTALEAS